MTQISILGCGWLGLPLAKTLMNHSYQIKGSTTSENKIAVLENSGISPFLIAVSENGISGNFADFLEGSDILVIDIPPKLRAAKPENFVSKIGNLISFIEKSTVSKVLFISSTSVYADDNTVVTEIQIPNPDNESGRQLYAAENLLLENAMFETTILRFGGLIGADRHPIKFLAGKQNLENQDGPVNLIDQKDCIGIILEIVRQQCWNEVFNAAAPFHPSRKKYYSDKATSLQLPLPQFDTEKKSVGKTIDSQKLISVLNYEFIEKEL